MGYTWKSVVLAATVITLSVITVSSQPVSAAGFSAEVEQALETSTYAYIASERKSGELGTLVDPLVPSSLDAALLAVVRDRQWLSTPPSRLRQALDGYSCEAAAQAILRAAVGRLRPPNQAEVNPTRWR